MPFLHHCVHMSSITSLCLLSCSQLQGTHLSGLVQGRAGNRVHNQTRTDTTSDTKNYHYQISTEFMTRISNHIILITSLCSLIHALHHLTSYTCPNFTGILWCSWKLEPIWLLELFLKREITNMMAPIINNIWVSVGCNYSSMCSIK